MFHKTARVRSLGSATFTDNGLAMSLRKSAAASDYLDGSRRMDVSSLLQENASKYAISSNPRDYIYEAMRACTAQPPNENDDGFRSGELLRYDLSAGRPVYGTFVGKPHHLNHATANPYEARGIILDAHYNDRQPVAEHCARCGSRTADVEGRDATGLHCKACGHLVKDAFVEILVAVDTKKDAFFAEGVKSGELDSGSMGCSCLTTVCNVCHHVAHSKNDFCEHIRGANKGSLWVPDTHRGWRKISEATAIAEMKRVGLAPVLEDFCYVKFGGLEIRKGFEYCEGVEFDEYSRVVVPADRKARTTELLQVSKVAEGPEIPSPEALRKESEALLAAMQQARRRRQAQELPADPDTGSQGAEEFYVVDGPSGPSAFPNADQADAASPGQPVTKIHAPTETEALTEWRNFMTTARRKSRAQDQTMVVQPPSGVEVLIDPVDEVALSEPDLALDQSLSVEPSSEDFQPQASWAYGNWTVKKSGSHVALIDPTGTPRLRVRAANARGVKRALKTSGLVGLARKYRISQILDGADFAMAEDMKPSPQASGLTDRGVVDHAAGPPEGKKRLPDDGATDMQDTDRSKHIDNIYDGGMDAAQRTRPDKPRAITDEAHHTQREQPKPRPKSTLDSEVHDHAEPLSSRKAQHIPSTKELMDESRLKMRDAPSGYPLRFSPEETDQMRQQLDESREQALQQHNFDPGWTFGEEEASARSAKLFAAKLAKAKEAIRAELEEEMDVRLANFQRALYIVAARQDRGLLESTLRENLVRHLAAARSVGSDPYTGEAIQWQGLPSDLAQHLVAAAWHEARGADLEDLVKEAAKLLENGETFMVQAEKDLQGLGAPKLPKVTSRMSYNSEELRALQMRAQAVNGNIVPRTYTASASASPGVVNSPREAMRQALASTTVGVRRAQFAGQK